MNHLQSKETNIWRTNVVQVLKKSAWKPCWLLCRHQVAEGRWRAWMHFKEEWSTGRRDVKAWLSGSVWLPPVTQGSSLKNKSSVPQSHQQRFWHSFMWLSWTVQTKWFYSKVVLNRTVEATTATEDSREQRRLGAPGALFCEAEKTGCAMKAALE